MTRDNVLGQSELDELLAHWDKINHILQAAERLGVAIKEYSVTVGLKHRFSDK